MNPGCTGKRQFLTFTSANGAARNASRSNNEPMRPYACKHCHKFHIGNAKKDQHVAKRPRPEYARTRNF